MSRTHDDDWDLASSVGATATMVAAGRAMATADPRRLIDDPFAAPLVRAVGIDFFTQMVDGQVDGDGDVRWTALYRQGDRLVGALTINGQTVIMKYRRMIAQKASWSEALEFAEKRRALAEAKAAAS